MLSMQTNILERAKMFASVCKVTVKLNL